MKKFYTILSVLALAVVLPLTGCATSGAVVKDIAASQAPKPTAVPTVKKEDGVHNFGDVKTYTDGVSLSVSEPAPFVPSDSAYGVVAGQSMVMFTVVLTNNSKKVLEPTPYTTVSSGGAEAEAIFDTENPIGNVGSIPQTAILPGQTVQWIEAFTVLDANSLTLESSPSYDYDKALFAYIK